MRRTTRIFSWILILAGIALVAVGVRTVFLSYWGQSTPPPPPPSIARSEPETYSPGDLIGSLSIPRLDARWTLYEGTGERELVRGPGHLEGTARPGSGGNCVIAGHRDTHFRALKDVRAGDDILLQSAKGNFRYRVTDVKVVYPSNTQLLQPVPGPTLTLVTCFPFYYVGPAPKRYIVRAEMVGLEHTPS